MLQLCFVCTMNDTGVYTGLYTIATGKGGQASGVWQRGETVSADAAQCCVQS